MSTHESFKEIVEEKRSSDRSFAFVIGIVFIIIAFLPILKGQEPKPWSIFASVVFFLFGIFFPKLFYYPNFVWFKFGMLLGHIVSPIILTLVYLLTFVPVGLLLRLLKKDLLKLKYDSSAKSYWIDRNPSGPDGQTLENQF